MAFLFISAFFATSVIVLAILAWKASRGRPQEPAEKRAWSIALLISSLSLLGLVWGIVQVFSSVPVSSDHSDNFRFVSNGINWVATLAYIGILVPVAFASRISLAAGRRFRQSSAR